MESPCRWQRNSTVFGAKFICIRMFGAGMARQTGQLGLPDRIDGAVGNVLDKIRNIRYAFPLSESHSHRPVGGRESEKPRLFETLAHNLRREPERGSDFLNYIARNSLKRLD